MQVPAGTSKKNRPTSGNSHNVAFSILIGMLVSVQKSFGLFVLLLGFVVNHLDICNAANANALKLSCELLRNFVTGCTGFWFS